MTVGERIRERRKELGLTQEELAFRMGYNGKSSVCAAETGGDNVTTTKVRKFAEALNTSYYYLMFGSNAYDDVERELEDMDRRTRERVNNVNRVSIEGSLTDKEVSLIVKYRNTSDEMRSAIDRILDLKDGVE